MILFLDFDGVLHPVRATIDQFFCHAPLLDTYLQRHHADAKIVLSTSWREPHSIEELLDFLPDTLHHRILGLTTLRPLGRRFLLQDANVLARQCSWPRLHRGRARCRRHRTSIVLFQDLLVL